MNKYDTMIVDTVSKQFLNKKIMPKKVINWLFFVKNIVLHCHSVLKWWNLISILFLGEQFKRLKYGDRFFYTHINNNDFNSKVCIKKYS